MVWEGIYDSAGNRVAPLRAALPFQTVETVNESEVDRLLRQDWRNRACLEVALWPRGTGVRQDGGDRSPFRTRVRLSRVIKLFWSLWNLWSCSLKPVASESVVQDYHWDQ